MLSSKLQLILFLVSSGEHKGIPVPTTLVDISYAGKSLLIHTKEGKLHTKNYHRGIDPFLDLCRTCTTGRYLSPKFIHYSNDGVSLVSSDKECLSLFEKYRNSVQIVQKYVLSTFKTVRKYRVRWALNEYYDISLVANLNQLKLNKEYQVNKTSGAYMHQLSCYPFAGRLFKSSFSPHYPNSSILLSPRLKETRSLRVNNVKKPSQLMPTTDNTFPTEKYLVFASRSCIHLKVPSRLAELENIVKECQNMVESLVKKYNYRTPTAGTFDFIKDQEGAWSAIGCRLDTIDNKLLLRDLTAQKFKRQFTYNTLGDKNEFNKSFTAYFNELVFDERFLKLNRRVDQLKAICNSNEIKQEKANSRNYIEYVRQESLKCARIETRKYGEHANNSQGTIYDNN